MGVSNKIFMASRSNIIYLIGNGFDLAHGLKTSYKDFFIYYIKSCLKICEKKYRYDDHCLSITYDRSLLPNNDLLGYFENTLRINRMDLLLPIQKLIFVSTRRERVKSQPLTITPKNDFIKELLLDCLNNDWAGIEDAIFRNVVSSHLNLTNEKDQIARHKNKSSKYQSELDNIKSLNLSVNCLKEHLINYLKTQNSPKDLLDNYFSQKLLRNVPITKSEQAYNVYSRNILFLNFNYTTYYIDLIENLKNNSLDKWTNYDHINIHGSLDEKLDDIIFGIGDEQNEYYSEIETFYDNEWLYCMKSFHYLRNQNYQNLLSFLEAGPYEIYIYGHSCSITDRTLLNMIFENINCKSIDLFHYNGMDSYLKTSYNVARNFKDKVKLRKVLKPYDPRFKM